MLNTIKRFILGDPIDPMDEQTRKHIALTAFFAWVGLGADGLSSSCYGPQEAFLALGQHTQLAFYLAIATAITVFIISFAYNQVVELFPNGGGGYKTATQLLGPNAGVVTGSALLVDYVLTIVISIAGGTDAFFSLLPVEWQVWKVKVETLFIIILMVLNLRGMKESIKILMPIFIGFVITHLFLISYGMLWHGSMLPDLVHHAVHESHRLALLNGGMFVAALFLHSYSIGGGTYTGLEAVSNNVNTLAEPRIRTGKWTMFYMAVSLSITAAGIILLYLLWNVQPVSGQTLNAVVFGSITQGWTHGHWVLTITMAFEFGLLFVGANTGFLGGPAVLANMAMDHWVPNRFRNLSSRLTIQNGIVLFGIAAILLLNITHGSVAILVVLYSINVFLAFMISLFGLCKHWFKERSATIAWAQRMLMAGLGFIICAFILCVIVVSRFSQGGWEAILITGSVIAFCYYVRNHYQKVNVKLDAADAVFTEIAEQTGLKEGEVVATAELDSSKPTAVFFVSKSRGAGMHTLLWVQRLFPDYFKNYIFVSAGNIDVKSFGAEVQMKLLERSVNNNLNYFKRFAEKHKIPVRIESAYGTDPVEECVCIAERVIEEFPNCVFFASQLVLEEDNWFTRRMHNETAFSLQRRLHLLGRQMMIMPMQLR